MVANNNGTSSDSVGPTATAAFNSFPIVKPHDIMTALTQELDVQVILDDITKPTSSVAFRCFQAFLNALSGISDEEIDRTKVQIQGQMLYKELYEDALTIRLKLAEIKSMMKASMVHDFTLQDLTRPDPKRFRKHLSALINFYRFKADRVLEVGEFEAETEELTDRREDLLSQNDTVSARIEHEKARRLREAPVMEQLKEENEKLSAGLMELKNVQTKLMEEVETARAEKASLTKQQTENMQDLMRLNQTLQKLQGRVHSSPKKLKTDLETRTGELSALRANLSVLEARTRDLTKKCDVLERFEEDLKMCQALLEGVKIEVGRVKGEVKEHDALLAQIQETREGLSEHEHRQQQFLSRLAKAEERVSKVRDILERKRTDHKNEKELKEQDWKTCQENESASNSKIEELKNQVNHHKNQIETTEEQYKSNHVVWIQTRDNLVAVADKYIREMTRMLSMDPLSPIQ